MHDIIRSKNLSLIRWMNSTHKYTAKLLERVTNDNYISEMARGIREISDYTAKNIEKELALPEQWMDRDHIKKLRMSLLDWKIHEQLTSLPESAKKNLLAFIAAIEQPALQIENSVNIPSQKTYSN